MLKKLVKNQTKLTRLFATNGLVLLSLLLPVFAYALDFKSVAVQQTILYDAPSVAGNKTFILGNNYPVEVIVNLGEWIKVRDHFGALNWVQGKDLSTKRTAMVKEIKAYIKQSPDDNSVLLGTLEKDVIVEIVNPTANNGWIKVKHRDGIVGYVPANTLWGI